MWGTSQGLISFLEEEDDSFKIHGLTELLKVVNDEWPQIAEQIAKLEKLAYDENFSGRDLAASLASRTLYYMGNLDLSVEYALIGQNNFNVRQSDAYSKTLTSHAIGEYCRIVNTRSEPPKNLYFVIKHILDDLCEDQKYGEALALAIECRSLDHVRTSLHAVPELVTHAIKISNRSVSDIEYRSSLLQLFVEFATTNCDKFILSQLHHSLNDAKSVSLLLQGLKESASVDNWLIAYQIAFELAENASQKYRSQIIDALPEEMAEIKDILKRKKLLELYLNFLFKNYNKDLIQIIEGLRDGTDEKAKLVHTSAVLSYSLMFAGTGDDNFFRNNTKWFINTAEPDWAEFITIAAIGTIHNGRLDSALQILGPYLRNGSAMHSLGGALFALGLIYANYLWDNAIVETITKALSNTTSSVVKHGGCLGLGLVAMGSQEEKYYDIVNNILQQDDPIAGEAAGYATGLIMLGCGDSDALKDLLNIARNTVHEKITRGASLGLAFMMYGLEDKSDALVEILLNERSPIMRETAAWVTSLAYVGTASNSALQRLLHIAISDVNDNVRRAATIGVGFVLSRNPKRVPSMIELLAKSYNPAVRNGAALALGVACAGTGNSEAIEILKPLLKDLEPFVVQSATIAMAMVLQEQSDVAVPYCKEFRAHLRKIISKNVREISQFGMAVAYGILNAGGRNVVISCNTLQGENSTLATVGLAMFCNFFYWHPLTLMLTLSFHPTAIIGLDENLNTPDWIFFSEGKPSLFADPPSFNAEAPVLKIGEARVLSITKPAEKKPDDSTAATTTTTPPTTTPPPPTTNENSTTSTATETTTTTTAAADTTPPPNKEEAEARKEGEGEKTEEAKEKEAEQEKTGEEAKEKTDEDESEFQELQNNSRVTLNQLPTINLDFDFNYAPVTPGVHHGIVMLKKTSEE